MLVVIGGFIFLMFCFFVFGLALKRAEKQKRLLGMVVGGGGFDVSTSWVDRVEKSLAKVFPTQMSSELLEKQLRQAGRPFGWDAHDVTIWRITLAVVLLAISFLASTSLNGHIVIGIIFAVIGAMVPKLLIMSYKSVRQGKIRKQLRSFQMMLALLASTDIRFDQAVHEAIKSTSGEFRAILDRMEQRLNFNSTVKEGFAWLAEETGLKELTRLNVVIEQATENGTKVGVSLQAMIQDYDNELENKIERLSQNVNLKVTLTVIFLIVGPSIGFDAIIAGINFLQSFNSF